MTHATKERRVAVLMAVYNGEAFLERQLETLASQSVSKIDLWISDDGSSDNSRAIIRNVRRRWTKGQVHVFFGPGKGFAENFRSLLVSSTIDADYFAFCDQDDVWEVDKLESALQWLSSVPDDVPAVFCTRTKTVTVDEQMTGHSPLFRKEPSFRNAIVQSIAGGNTMVMNRKAQTILIESSRRTSFVSHDWWAYMIITGVGGIVYYSPVANISYRQHNENLVGANNYWRARFQRIRFLFAGRFAEWNDRNLAALAACEDMLDPEARETIRLFSKARSSSSLFTRLVTLIRSKIYRQTLSGHVGLYVACILKKL